ncbi:protease modulator HflK [Vibrio sp. WXL210]|uniref:protease modulator HflK n=1 Tax=Vibrio sp. WXL210 TaxID=3450709 RepID=UPI003EC63B66
MSLQTLSTQLGEDAKLVAQQTVKLCRLLVLVVVPCIYFLSGFYTVGVDERALVVRFGQVLDDNVLPGIHYRMPWPIDEVHKLSATELKSMTIDYDKISRSRYLQPELITQEGDLIDVKFDVQYNIERPSQFFYSVENPEEIVRQMAISEAIHYISNHQFQMLLTVGRSDFQNQLKNSLQEKVRNLGMGINIIGVLITHLDAPKNIKAAFDRVQIAPAEKSKIIQMAEGEQTTQVVVARSNAAALLAESQAYAEYTVNRARGDAELFYEKSSVQQNSPEIIYIKEYIAAIESILNSSRVKLVEAR